MSDGQPDLTDAYDTLGQLMSFQDRDRQQLKAAQAEAARAGVEYDKQLEEARAAGDDEAVLRCEQLVEQAQQTWVMAAHALGEYDKPPANVPEEASASAGDEDGGSDAAV